MLVRLLLPIVITLVVGYAISQTIEPKLFWFVIVPCLAAVGSVATAISYFRGKKKTPANTGE